MEKILLLCDAIKFNAGILDFATYFARLHRSKIVGVFIEQHRLDTAPSVKSIGGYLYVEEITPSSDEINKDEAHILDNVAVFKEGCLQREVSAVLHRYKNSSVKDIIHETRYADLVILDPSLSAPNDGSAPSKLAMEILAHAECPVLIASENFEQPEEIVLAYNGSRSSVFAIKQFYYQFPCLADKKYTVVQVIENEAAEAHPKEHELFHEWLQMHFPHVSFEELKGDPRTELLNYFMDNNDGRNKLLVTGAYGRNFLSSLLQPSTADLLLKAIDVPVFIAHH